MLGDIFHSYNLRIFSKVLRRTDDAVLEVVTNSETRYLIIYLRPQKVWRIEEINSEGFVHVDYQPKLNKCIEAIHDIDRIVVRRLTIEERH